MAFTVGELEVKIKWSEDDQKKFAKSVATNLAKIEKNLPTLNINVMPSFDNFFAQMGRETKALDNVFAVQVNTLVDKTKLLRDITTAVESAEKFVPSLDIGTDVDASKIVKKATSSIKVAKKTIPVLDIPTDFDLKIGAIQRVISRARAEIRTVNELKSLGIDIDLDVDMADLLPKVREAVLLAEKTAPKVDVKMDVDPTKLLGSLTATINSVEKLLPAMDLRLNTSGLKPAAVASGLSSGAVPATVGAAGALGVGAVAQGVVAGFGVKTAAELQTTQVAFEGLLGSAEEATKFLQELRDFTIKTPFDFFEITDSAQKLVSTMKLVGKTPADVIPMLQVLGDVAAAGGAGEEEIRGVVRALGQMSSKSKVSAQDLNQISEQFANWGVRADIAEIAAKRWGVTLTEAKDRIEKDGFGQLEFASIFDELVVSMKEVPGAADAMARQFDTLKGKWSSLKESFKLGLGNLFLPQLPGLQTFVEQLTVIAPSLIPKAALDFIPALLTDLVPALTVASNMFNTLFEAINPVIAELPKVFVPLMGFVTQFINGLTSSGAVDVLAAIGTALTQVFDSGVIGTFGETVGMIVDSFGSIIQDLNVQGFFVQLGDAFEQVLVALQPLLPALAQAVVELLPAMIPLIEMFTKTLTLLVNLLVDNPDTLKFFVGLAGALVVLSPIISGIAPIIGGLVSFLTGFLAVAGNFAAAGGLTSFFAALATTLSGPVIPIVIAIIASLPAMIKIFGVAFEEMKRVFSAFQPVFVVFIDVFKIVFGLLKALADFLADTIIIPVIRMMGDAFVWIGDAVAPAYEALHRFLELFQKNPGEAIGLLWEKIKDLGSIISDFGKNIIAALPGIWSSITEAFTGIGSAIWDGLVSAAQWLEQNWTKLVGVILAAPFLALGALLFGAFKIGEFIFNAIKNVISWLWDHKDELFNFLVDVLSRIFDFVVMFATKVLPNIVVAVAGFIGNLVSILVDAVKGIPGLLGDVGSFLFDVGKSILKGLEKAFFYIVENVPEIFKSFNSVLQGIPGKIIGFLVEAFKVGKDFAGKIADGIKNIFVGAFGLLVDAGSWLKDNWLKLIGGIIAVPFAVGFLVGKLALKLGEFIIKGISMIIGAVPDVLSALWNVFVNVLEFLFITLPTKSVELGIKLGGFFKDALLAIPGLLADVGGLLWDGIKWVFDKVLDGVIWYVSTVIDFWVKLPGRIVDDVLAVGGWLWDGMRWIFDRVVDGVSGVIENVIDFFVKLPGRIVNILSGIGSVIWDAISGGFNFVKDNISSWVDSIIDLFKNIGSGIVDGILSAVKLVVGGFNKIIEGFNWVGDFVGMPPIRPISLPEFHEGGRVGSGGRMRPALRQSSDEQLAILLTDEEVIPREVVRKIPASAWEQLRQGDFDAFAESAQFAGGTVNNDRLRSLSVESGGPLDIAKNFLSNPLDSLFDVFSGIKDGLANMLSGAFDSFGEGVGGRFGEIMRGLIGVLRDKVLSFFGVIKDEIAGSISPNFDISGVSDEVLQNVVSHAGQAGNYNAVIDYMRATGVPFVPTSTFRPFSITASGNQSYHSMGRAVDFAGLSPSVDSQALANIFWALAPLNNIIPGGIKELIYAGPQVDENIKNGDWVAKYAQDLHHNHVHFAFENGALVNPVPGGLLARIAEGGSPEMVLPMSDAKYSRRVQLLDNSGVTGEVLNRYHMAQAQNLYNNKSEKNVTYNVTQQLPPVSDPGLFASAATYRLARL